MIKKIYRLLAVLAAVIITASLVKGLFLAPITAAFPVGETNEITEITARDWTETGIGVYYYTIPENISSAQVLEITGNWISMKIYLEDTLLYSFDDEHHELGRASHWIDIPEGSGGKRIIYTSESAPASVEKSLHSGNYLGTADAVRHHFFMKNLPVLLFVVVDVMMAVVAFLILTVLRHKLSSGFVHALWDLIFFVMLNGIWLISDCGFLECFTTRTGLWALISYIAFMLMPVFMVRFAQHFLTYRWEPLHALGVASLCLTSATLLLYITRLAPLNTLLIFHQVLMMTDFVVIFLRCNYEIRRYRIKRLAAVRSGVVLMGIFSISTVLAYWQGLNALYPLLFGFGFICYIVSLTISVVQQSYCNISKNAKMETYRKLAYEDAMTMIYNRSAFVEYQKGMGANARETAYILFDINNLKTVNDMKGHHVGDDLIVRAASCIRETFEEVGSCYRIGGDEFMVVVENIHSEAEVQSLLEHFDMQVELTNEGLAKNQSILSIAYGYSLAGEKSRSGEEMYEEADAWMYRRKRGGRAASRSDR